MFELYSTGMKTQQLEEEEMFICHIHNYTEYNPAVKWRYAFNPSKSTHTWSSGHIHTWSSGHTYTPGAVDTHTHLEQRTHTHTHTQTHTDTHTWSSGHTHTHTPGAVSTHTHTHTHLEQSTLRRPGSSWGFSALLKGLTSVVDNSCRSREPTTSDYKSSALSIRPRLHLDYNLQLYCVTSHTVWLSKK